MVGSWKALFLRLSLAGEIDVLVLQVRGGGQGLIRGWLQFFVGQGPRGGPMFFPPFPIWASTNDLPFFPRHPNLKLDLTHLRTSFSTSSFTRPFEKALFFFTYTSPERPLRPYGPTFTVHSSNFPLREHLSYSYFPSYVFPLPVFFYFLNFFLGIMFYNIR